MSRATFFRLHSWLGIVTGLFMLVIAWSGSIVVFKHEIEWIATSETRADPARGTRSIDEVLTALRGRYPGASIALNLQYGPRFAHAAYVRGVGSVGSGGGSETRYVLIDPATARISKEYATAGYTWSLHNFLRQFHVRLLMGYWGRVFVGALGVTLVLSIVTSLWIYRDWLRSLVRVRRQYGRRIFHMDLHKAVGLWSLVINLIFGVTGAVLGLENAYRAIWPRQAAVKATPATELTQATRATRATQATPQARAGQLTLAPGITVGQGVAMLAARDRTFVPTVVEVPAGDGPAGDGPVGEGPVVVRGDHPGALIATGQSAWTLDLRRGTATAAQDARRVGWGPYLYNTMEPLHFGNFGLKWGPFAEYTIKTLWCIAGLTPGVLSMTGGYMWLLRRRRARAAAAARHAYKPVVVADRDRSLIQ